MRQTVTFFGGLHTIGGINVMVGCGDTAIIFDLGRMPTGYFNWYGSNVSAPAERAIREYILVKNAPPVMGLYDPKLLGDLTGEEITAAWEGKEFPGYKNLFAFVSHIHQDHMALLPYIAENITVFMHEEALVTYKAVVASGEYTDSKARLVGLPDGGEQELGDGMSIKIVELDHDTPGASGILVRTPDHKVFFTGDYRLHGRHSHRVEDKIKMLREENITLLITEGTTLRYESLDWDKARTHELDLPFHYKEMLKDLEGLAYINILARNVERVADFINATRECGRKLVMDCQTARLWHTAIGGGIKTLEENPALSDTDTVVLLDEAVSGLPYGSVTLRDIVSKKGEYTVYLTQRMLPLMIEFEKLGQKCRPSRYFHADGNPLTDTDPTLTYWLRELGVEYHYHGTGGHAIPKMLTFFVTGVNPKVVVPVHSVNPSILDTGNVRKLLPSYGQTINLEDIAL